MWLTRGPPVNNLSNNSERPNCARRHCRVCCPNDLAIVSTRVRWPGTECGTHFLLSLDKFFFFYPVGLITLACGKNVPLNWWSTKAKLPCSDLSLACVCYYWLTRQSMNISWWHAKSRSNQIVSFAAGSCCCCCWCLTSLLIPQMYDNMTTYMLSDSPESGSGSNHQMGGSSSNAPSLIGSPRSTPVFGNGHAHKV